MVFQGTTGTGTVHIWIVGHSMSSGKVKHQNRSQSLLGCHSDLYLDPWLFTLYMNDFLEYVDNTVDMYADNTTLSAHVNDIKTVENKLTEMYAKAAQWMKNNKLTLHLGKTKAQFIY